LVEVKIKYSRYSKKWLARNNISRERLSFEILQLCRKIGRTSHRKIYIHIKRFGFDSEFVYRGSKLIIGNFANKNRSQRYRVKCTLIALLHELRHFMQMRMFLIPRDVSYSTGDIRKNNSRYYNDPLEVDARRYERKHIKRFMQRVYSAN